MTCIVRSKIEPVTLLRTIRKELKTFDSERAIFGEEEMTVAIAESLSSRRFSLIVLGAFATVALVLSIIGIYGVVSYLVGQRTNEIGVRMTLGAQPRDIFIWALHDGAIMSALGVSIGLAAAAGLTRLMTNLLFGISATDLGTFACAALALVGLTTFACYVPARRAARIDPASALRHS